MCEITSIEEGKPFSICKHKVHGQYKHPDGSEFEFCILIEMVNTDVKTTHPHTVFADNCLLYYLSGNVAGTSFIPSTENMLHSENITKYNGFWH